MFSFLNGIIPVTIIQRLQKLALSKEDSEILNKLEHIVKAFKYTQTFSLILETIFQFIIISISLFGPLFKDSLLHYKFLALLITLTITVLYIIIRLTNSYHFNYYHRTIRTLLTIILTKIFQSYRISLATQLSKIPDPHIFTDSFTTSAFAVINTSNKMSKLIALLISFLFSIVIYPFYKDIHILIIIGVLFITISSSIALLLFNKQFAKIDKKYIHVSDALYQDIKDTSAINIQTKSNYQKHKYFKSLKDTITFAQYINTITLGVSKISSIIIILLPFLSPNISPFIYLILPISSIGFLGGFATDYSRTKISINRYHELSNIISFIENNSSEMTSNQYELLKRKPSYISHPSKEKDLIIKNLKYISGRNENTQEIFIDKILLSTGKVNIFSGASGLGKSIFGKVITMKYAEFNCDFIGKSLYDFRKYRTLKDAYKELLYSGLREINTSYRSAISIYASQFDYNNNSLIRKVFNSSVILKEISTFYLKHSDYYKFVNKSFINNINTIQNIKTLKTILNNLSKQEFQDLSTKIKSIYKQISNINLLKYINKEFKDSNIKPSLVLNYLILLEYLSYKHIKSLIPEASLYFMDAILSEPPISQGQRRRILFALDIVLKSHVFVIDEPFSNLDFESSKTILNQIIQYTKDNNSTTLVLEPKQINTSIDILQKKQILGYNYRIERNSKNIIQIKKL